VSDARARGGRSQDERLTLQEVGSVCSTPFHSHMAEPQTTATTNNATPSSAAPAATGAAALPPTPVDPTGTTAAASAPAKDPATQSINMRCLIVTQDASIIIGKSGKHVNEIRVSIWSTRPLWPRTPIVSQTIALCSSLFPAGKVQCSRQHLRVHPGKPRAHSQRARTSRRGQQGEKSRSRSEDGVSGSRR
jgi:poly(rC)-binding protein 2/3/4